MAKMLGSHLTHQIQNSNLIDSKEEQTMIEHVEKGQRIAASHINSLIDNINFIDGSFGEYTANAMEGSVTKPNSFILEAESVLSGAELSSQKPVISSIGCYNIRFEDGNSEEPITAEDKTWTEDLDSISSIWLVKDGEILSVVNDTELDAIGELSTKNIWKLFDVEVSADVNGFSIVNDYRDIAFGYGRGGGGGGGNVVPDMSSLNYVEEIDTSAQISVTGSGTADDPFVVKSTNPDGTIKEQVLDPSGRNTLQNPGWAHVSNDIREYWVNGGMLRGGTTPLEEGWAKGGTLQNPWWQKGGTIGNPYWKNGGTIQNPASNGGRLQSTSPLAGADSSASEEENAKILQNWNYNTPLSDDRIDITDVSALSNYSFLVRPEPYGGTLKYANLSAVISGGGGGGGGDCSCDVSAYFTSGDKLATWTNGTKTVDIYTPILSNDYNKLKGRIQYTPFYYEESISRIINNFFYVNRTLHEIHSEGYLVTGPGTYYLKISHYSNTDLYEIVQDTYTGLDTGGKQNTDSETFYKLWTIAPNFVFDWRQAPCIPFYERD